MPERRRRLREWKGNGILKAEVIDDVCEFNLCDQSSQC